MTSAALLHDVGWPELWALVSGPDGEDVQIVGHVPQYMHRLCIRIGFIGHGSTGLSVSHSWDPVCV